MAKSRPGVEGSDAGVALRLSEPRWPAQEHLRHPQVDPLHQHQPSRDPARIDLDPQIHRLDAALEAAG